jgi:hypothetical protein
MVQIQIDNAIIANIFKQLVLFICLCFLAAIHQFFNYKSQ